MKKLYEVVGSAEIAFSYEVEAESENDAHEKAMEMFNEDVTHHWDTFYVDEVIEVDA